MTNWGDINTWGSLGYWGTAPGPYTLVTPVALERVSRELWWVKERRGISLIKTNGVWSQIRYPIEDLWATHTEGTDLFLGGHEYTVDASLRADLIASGVVTSDNFI